MCESAADAGLRDGARVSMRGLAIAVWQALALELPPKRMKSAARFVFGGLPLNDRGRESLLRAIMRASIECGYTPVAKDSKYDPVELLAAALDVMSRSSASDLSSAVSEIAVRYSGFEMLFSLSISSECREQWRSMIDRLRRLLGDQIVDEALKSFHGARLTTISGARSHRDVVLADMVVLGSAHVLTVEPSMRFARAMFHVRARRFEEALAIFEAILDDVPGHGMALAQAARCCDVLGRIADASSYTQRVTSRTAPASPRRSGVALHARAMG